MSGLLLLCTELTLFCIELPENCFNLNQSELSNLFMYIINSVTFTTKRCVSIYVDVCGEDLHEATN